MPRYFEDVAVGDTFESLNEFHITRDTTLPSAQQPPFAIPSVCAPHRAHTHVD